MMQWKGDSIVVTASSSACSVVIYTSMHSPCSEYACAQIMCMLYECESKSKIECI